MPSKTLSLPSTQKGLHSISYSSVNKQSNELPYVIDELPECGEVGENGSMKQAQKISLPKIVNGFVSKPGDIDVYEISGKAGEKVVIEVYARRLNSPLDSIIKVTDAKGKELGLNDDFVNKDKHLHKDVMGLVTHHADSYLMLELPETGKYYVFLADAQYHGGSAHAYRLRISRPQMRILSQQQVI